MNWEDAVAWLRSQPGQQALVRACYYDDPVEAAVQRFHASEEFRATRTLLGEVGGSRVLDIGAGRGIASFAFAREGALVTALEPDPSPLVGAEAIKHWSAALNTPVDVVQTWGECLPFANRTFDIVYARAVLHHARDLGQLCREIGRVLKPQGRLLACREHVLSGPEQRAAFLAAHPLHHLYGGENAYTLTQYLGALMRGGLFPTWVAGPHGSVINFAPAPEASQRTAREVLLRRRLGFLAPGLGETHVAHALASAWLSIRNRTPGRHFAFLCRALGV